MIALPLFDCFAKYSYLQYLESLIERKPDIYLSELKEQLEAAYEVRVDETTISRTLKRRGYARKKVCGLTQLYVTSN